MKTCNFRDSYTTNTLDADKTKVLVNPEAFLFAEMIDTLIQKIEQTRLGLIK